MAASLAGGVKETGSRRLWRRSRLTVARPLFFFLSSNRESRVWHKADVIIALTDVRFPDKADILSRCSNVEYLVVQDKCGQCAGVLTMRLIQFREPGPPAVMQCLDVPIPEPASGEVLIRAHAIGVGMPDCLIRAGTYSVMPPLPATPGTELAGVIEKVGPSVTTRREGQRVYTTARERPHRGGHYAEYVATPAEATFLLPDMVDFEAAAALANYQVAYHIINDALWLRKGQTVLIFAAAGGMGNALIDLAKAADLSKRRTWFSISAKRKNGSDNCWN
jgi:D-arabinose 1-dehydrogenase-like Zn-dependent alcohol dehydrogenase